MQIDLVGILAKKHGEANLLQLKRIRDVLTNEIENRPWEYYSTLSKLYRNTLEGILKQEPKEKLLETLLHTSPHTYFENLIRVYHFEDYNLGKIGSTFVDYLLYQMPYTSLSTLLKVSKRNLEKQLLEKIPKIKQINTKKELLKYMKYHDNEYDPVFKIIKPYLKKAIKKQRKNFFTSLLFEGCITKVIAKFLPDQFIKNLIKDNRNDFTKILMEVVLWKLFI